MTLEEKIFKIQQEIGTISKDSINPFYNSKYFDINKLLEALKPLLEKHKILLLQPLTTIGEKPALETRLIDLETDGVITSIISLPENPDPQKMGSIITYFRRYALQSLLALQAEDDDANLASGTRTEKLNETKGKVMTGEAIDINDWQDYIEGDKEAAFEINETKKTYKRSHEKCGFCGADMIINPKTNKKFCSAKCWLKKKGK